VAAAEVVGVLGGGKPQAEGTEVTPEGGAGRGGGGAAFGVCVKAEEEKMCVSSVLQSMTNAGMSVSAQMMFGSLEVLFKHFSTSKAGLLVQKHEY
jgi:hypothetical protein